MMGKDGWEESLAICTNPFKLPDFNFCLVFTENLPQNENSARARERNKASGFHRVTNARELAVKNQFLLFFFVSSSPSSSSNSKNSATPSL